MLHVTFMVVLAKLSKKKLLEIYKMIIIHIFIGEDPFTLWVIGTTIFTFFVYWFFGAIYTIMDVTNRPAGLRRYKIQPGTNEPVDTRRLINVNI